ncbi:hypothetical protein [Acinetobacter phage HFM1]|nr:hypothetical protein [Acinetobacter phage HFM1]
MSLSTLVYLAGLSDSVMCALIFITIILGILCFIKTIQDEEIHKKSLVGFIVTILICSLLPSKETVYTMIVVDDKRVQNIGNGVLDILDKKIQEIKEAEKTK